jgi:hypothetical protein
MDEGCKKSDVPYHPYTMANTMSGWAAAVIMSLDISVTIATLFNIVGTLFYLPKHVQTMQWYSP